MNHERYTQTSFWFERYSKTEYTKYVQIEATIFWSYYIAAKYRDLVEVGNTKEANIFIDKHRSEIINKMTTALATIKEWSNAPSCMRFLLTGSYKVAGDYLSHSIKMSDKINFHKIYGVEIEENLDVILESIEKEQNFMRMYAQHTDEADISSLYYKWLNKYDESIKYLGRVIDNDTWNEFIQYCLKYIPVSLPAEEQIKTSAEACISHLEVFPSVKNEVTQKFVNLWLQLFNSSAQHNRSLLFLASSKKFPSDNELNKYESLLVEAKTTLFNSSIPLANLLLDENIYSRPFLK